MLYRELQDAFIELTFLLRGFDYNDENSPGQELVRLSYQANSQPFQQLKDDISYIWVNYADASTSSQINERKEYVPFTDRVKSKKYQTRKLDVHWTFYGETAQDSAFKMRQNLFSNKAKEFLDKYNIKLIPDVPEVVLFFEEVNKRWWPRVDIVVSYYIESEITEDLDYYEALEVVLSTEDEEITIN